MFEIFCLIEDELGSRSCPTGDGHELRNIAENKMLQKMIKEPTLKFYIEFIPTEDYFNAF